MKLQPCAFTNGCTNPLRKGFKILSSLLFHEEQFHLLLIGLKFTTMGKHKEQACEPRPMLMFIWGFVVQNSDKKY